MPGSIRFRVLINVELDGECYTSNDRLIIFESTFVTLRIVISTIPGRSKRHRLRSENGP